MIVNLDTELTGFREAIEGGTVAQVQWREGHGGGGVSWPLLLLLTSGLLLRRRWR
jgi:uncharacterized protein (TIGR03382 family)